MDAKQLLTMIRQIRETALMSGIITPDKPIIVNLGLIEYSTLVDSLLFYYSITGYVGDTMYIDGGKIIVNRREDTKNRMEIDFN